MSHTLKKTNYTAIQRKEMTVGYFMLFPAVAGLTVFVIVPLFLAVQKSFYDWNFYQESVWVGWKNFRIILSNASFKRAIITSFKYVIILVPLQIVIQFAFASLLKNLSIRFSNLTKIVIYIPGVVSGIVAGIIFIFIFEYSGGLANQLITAMGFKRIAFQANPVWAMFSICAPVIWLGLGGGTILNYAGLISVPDEYYEAASIDGAGSFRKLINITIPQMRNIFILQIIGLTTGTLQILEIPMVMTGGGPREQTLSPMLYMYNNFKDLNRTMGYTIAGALLMMILIAIINSFIFTVIRSEKTMDG
jgi:ABC-type sugar transport system permease subunit